MDMFPEQIVRTGGNADMFLTAFLRTGAKDDYLFLFLVPRRDRLSTNTLLRKKS